MAKDVEPEQGEEFSQDAWRATYKEFLKVKKEFGPALSQLRIRLPYAHYGKLTPVLENQGVQFGAADPEIFKHNFNLALSANFTTLDFTRVETSKGTVNRIFLEQMFPGKITSGYIEKVSGFTYSWNKRKITIKRWLNTTDVDVVYDQIAELVYECTRFKMMYCE